MHITKRMIFVSLVCLPVTAWSANLQYALDVKINTSEQKITCTARLKADAEKKINLSVGNLRKLKVDGNDVNTVANENISLTVQKNKEIIISYEALITDKETNFIDKDNVF